MIDTKTHLRYFECKINCIPKPVLPKREIEVPDITQCEESVEVREYIGKKRVNIANSMEFVRECSEAYAEPSVFQQIRNWLSAPRGYIKVKTQ